MAAAVEKIPPGCVVDGELVVWSGDRLDFDALQLRLVTARAALPALVRERPASFVAFDVLAVAGQDAMTLVDPIVVEVSADVAWSGQAFRHSLRLLRARPELDPADVQLPDHPGG